MAQRYFRVGALLALTGALLLGSPGRAEAASYYFAAQSLIIPMDICYQPSVGTGATPANGYCADPKGTADDGLTKAYGLVYRLLQQGVSIYYVMDPTKSAINGVDLTITAAAGTPVSLFDRSVNGGGSKEFMTNTHTSIAYRGAPFVIDSTDYQKVVTFLMNDKASTSPQFKNVDVHVAKQGFMAPVAALLNEVPPRIALLNLGGAAIGVLEGYLKDAGLYSGTSIAAYPSIGDVFTEFDNVSDFTTANGLVAGNFQILWAPHWEGKSMTSGDLTAVLGAISSFLDAGHPFFAECAAIATIEGATAKTSYGAQAAPTGGNFLLSVPAGKTALITNTLPQPTWPTKATEGLAFNASAMTNPLVQIGDFTFSNSVTSATYDFQPDTAKGAAWRTGVQHVVTSTAPANESSYQNLDILTTFHKDNDPKKGLIIYLGGHSYGSQGSTCNPTCSVNSQTQLIAGERLVLNSLVFLGQQPNTLELARSAPILGPDNTTYQGTYISQAGPKQAYPPWMGHFREYPPYVSSGTGMQFNQIKLNWDAAKLLPAAASRNIFTVVLSGGVMTKTSFVSANASLLGTPMGLSGAAVATAIDGIRGGVFGGIDHSTPAIIGPSSVAGSPTRPTVAYVGGLDGMLHAIGVSGSGVTPGVELWAFIPPSQLGLIAGYQAGVDGSPQVGDVFVDTTGSGVRTWHTLLAIPNRTFGGTIDVLDVTDPLHPAWMWTGSNTITGYGMGAASGAAFTTIGYGAALRGILLVATNNTGNAGNGVNLYALDAGRGTVVWQWNHLYSRKIPSTTTTVPNDVPAVPTAVDTTGDGSVSNKVYFGDLDGRMWEIDATTGTGANMLYDAGADGYPFAASLAVFRDATTNNLGLVGVTGGADWVTTNLTGFVVAVDAQHYQSGNSGLGTQLWKTNLGAGERVYAAPTVAGGDVYVFSSLGALNGNISSSLADLGVLRRISLGSGSIGLTMSLYKSAAEVQVGTDGSIVAASTVGLNIIGNAGRNGTSVPLDNHAKPATVNAWLDLH